MFEHRFKAIILKILGEFIEDFDYNELKVDSWNGRVTQHNVNLKSDALRFLSLASGLSMTVVKGVIGRLFLNLNWARLWSEPITLTLEDVQLVVCPNSELDATLSRDANRSKKRTRLLDLLKKSNFESSTIGYFKKLEKTIADNLVLSIKHLHIRYEDSISNPGQPFALGLTLERLTYHPCDAHWLQSFITLESKLKSQKSFMKLMINSVAVYHESRPVRLLTEKRGWLDTVGEQEFLDSMGSYIATSLYIPSISEYYILRPVNAEIRIRRSLLSPTESDIPKTSVNFLIDEMRISLEASQYQDLLMIGSLVQHHRSLGKYAEIRPKVRPLELSSMWWAYAIEAVRLKLRRRIEKRRWSYLTTRREMKLRYMDIYATISIIDFEKQTGKAFNISKNPELAGLTVAMLNAMLLDIEDKLTLEEVFLFRVLSERNLYAQAEQSTSTKKSSWWGFGWLYSSKVAPEEEAFMKSLEQYSEMIADVDEAPQAYVKSFMNFELRSCTVSLAGRQFTGLKAALLRVHFDRIIIQRQITSGYSQTYLALSSFDVTDPFTPCKKFSQLLRPVNSEETFYEIDEAEAESFPDANDGFLAFGEAEFSSPPVLLLNMEKGQSLKLKINVETTELLYNSLCLERFKNFFRSPEALQFYKVIEMQTLNQISSIKHRTQAKLEYIMKNHVDLQLDLHMSAPIVTVPLNPLSEDSALLVVDLGLLRVTSETKQNSSPRKFSQEFDISEFYDKYKVEVTDISVTLISPERNEKWALLDKFSIRMALEKCILPLDPNYTTVKVAGSISNLRLRLSKVQYSMLKQLQSEDSPGNSSSLSLASMDEPIYPIESDHPVSYGPDEDEDIFFDADEGSPIDEPTPAIKLPVHPDKEHLSVVFSIDEMHVQLSSDEHDEKAMLDSTVYGVDTQVCIIENRKVFRTKLRRVVVRDIMSRVLVDSDELSDLVTVDYSVFEGESLLLASVSHLKMQYYDEPIKWLLNLAKPDRKYFKKVEFGTPKKMHAEFRFYDIRARVNHDNSPLSEVVLAKLSATLDKHIESSLHVVVGAVEGIDFLTRTQFFSTAGNDLLSLKHWTDAGTVIELQSCKITLLMEMVRQLHVFVLESAPVVFLQKLKKRRSQYLIDESEAQKHKFEFKAFHPVIAFVDADKEVSFDLGKLSLVSENDKKTISIYGSTINFNLPQSNPLLSSFEFEANVFTDHAFAKLNRVSFACCLEQITILTGIFRSYTEHFVQLNKILHSHSAGVAAISAEAPQVVHRSLTKIAQLEEIPIKFSLQMRSNSIEFRWILENGQVCRTEFSGLDLDFKQREGAKNWWKLSLQKMSTLIERGVVNEHILIHQLCKEDTPVITVCKLSLQKMSTLIERGVVNEHILIHQLCKEDTPVITVCKVSPTHIDIDLAYMRLIISPFVLSQLSQLTKEVGRIFKPQPQSSPSQTYTLSGCINKLQVCISEDQTFHIDEEDSLEAHSSVAMDQKQLILIELTADFDDKNWNVSNFWIALECTNLVDAGIDLQGRLIVQPFRAASQVGERLQLLISKIDVDMSVEQIMVMQAVLGGFKNPKKSSESSVPCLNAEVQIQQLQLSISSDSADPKQPGEMFFTVLLDEPVIDFPVHPSSPVKLEAYVLANYFNHQVCEWEPLIEQVKFKIKCSIQEPGIPLFSLRSYGQFNVNVSTAMISTLHQFCLTCSPSKENAIFRIDHGYSSRHRLMSINSSLILKNETGQQLKYWVGFDSFMMYPNEEQSLDFSNLDEQTSLLQSFRGQMKAKRDLRNSSVALQVDELPKITGISLDKHGPTIYPINFNGHELGLICSIKLRQGDKVMTVKSPVEIRNNLSIPIEVSLTLPLHQKDYKEEYTEVIAVDPHSSAPVPITIALFQSLKVRVLGYDWSQKIRNSPETPLEVLCPEKKWSSSRKDTSVKTCSFVMNVAEQALDKIMLRVFEFDNSFSLNNLLCTELDFAVYRHNLSVANPIHSMSDQALPKYETDAAFVYDNSYTGKLGKGETFESIEVRATEIVSLALKLPGYEWSRPMVLSEAVGTTIYQFSRRNIEQINVFLESDRNSGSFKLAAYSQFWLENHTSLPIMFQHIEDRFTNVPMFLPYQLDDFLIEGTKVKNLDDLCIITAFDSSIKTKAKHSKPWLQHMRSKKPGFASLSSSPSEFSESSGLLTKMFSTQCDMNFTPQASVRVANSDWSEHFNLIAIAPDSRMLLSSTSVKAYEPSVSGKPGCIYEIAMSLHVPEAPFERTKLVKFLPRFVLINKVPFEMLITQFEPISDTDGVCRLQPNESTHFHWPDASRYQSLCIKLEDHGWQWSGSFNIDKPDDFFLRIRNRHTHCEAIIQVTVSQEGSTFQVVFSDASVMPPYRIENLSMENIQIYQTDVREYAKTIAPFEISSYAWDEPLLPKTLKIVIAGASVKSSINLGAYKLDNPSSYGPINLKKHGSHPAHALYIEITVEGSCKVLKIRHEQSEEEYKQHKRLMKPKGNFMIKLKLKHLGVSLLDIQPQELLYISLEQLKMNFERIQHDTKFDFSLQSFQVDNQLHNSQFPVVLRPHSEVADLRIFSFKLHMRENNAQDVTYIKQIVISPAHVNMSIEGALIERLLLFSGEVSEILREWFKESEGGKKKEKKFYFDKLVVSNLRINLSLSSVPSMFNQYSLSPLRVLLIIIANVGNVYLDFPALTLQHRQFSGEKLRRELASYYTNGCKSQLLSIILSSDILGNPYELLRQLQIGVRDLVTNTSQATFSGFAEGVSSLVKHTAYGASNSTSRFLDSLRKGIQSLYQDEQPEHQRRWSIVLALLRTALLVPNIVVSIASSTASHVRDAIHQQPLGARKRPPRCLLASKTLTPYSYDESLGQYILATVRQGQYLQEVLKHHFAFDELSVLITSKRVLGAVTDRIKPEWEAELAQITHLKLDNHKLLIFYFDDLKEIGCAVKTEVVSGDEANLNALKHALEAYTVQSMSKVSV
mmetsp:Transcript_7531/g.13999  ORF Transcript_7531/g.13999 Transcript_7531/m.13999 type:complete len:2958 (-) Transcript_7531:53-8926(-)